MVNTIALSRVSLPLLISLALSPPLSFYSPPHSFSTHFERQQLVLGSRAMLQALRLPVHASPTPLPPLLFAFVAALFSFGLATSFACFSPGPPLPPFLGFLLQGEQDSSNKKTKIMAPETGSNTRGRHNNGKVAAGCELYTARVRIIPSSFLPHRTAQHRTAPYCTTP